MVTIFTKYFHIILAINLLYVKQVCKSNVKKNVSSGLWAGSPPLLLLEQLWFNVKYDFNNICFWFTVSCFNFK